MEAYDAKKDIEKVLAEISKENIDRAKKIAEINEYYDRRLKFKVEMIEEALACLKQEEV